jgi:transposase-like protein
MGEKKKYRKFTEAYRELAVRRLQECSNISALCREFGISRQILYQWRDRFERRQQELEPARAAERQLRQENERLKRALADKALEVDFFKGALQKIEALRRGSTASGETASISKSEN